MTGLSPRGKILLYIVLVITVFISASVKISLVLLGTVLLTAIKVPFSALKRGLVPILFFLFFTFISNVLFHEGEVVYKILGLTVSKEGIVRGGELTLRLFILILGAKILTATTGAEDLVKGFSSLLGPVGRVGFVQELISTMSFTLRLLPIIYDEAIEVYRNIKNARERGLMDKIRLAVELLTNLFERSMKKAKEMSEAEEDLEY